MYSIQLSTSAKKDLKRLPAQVQDEIRHIHSHKIKDAPYQNGIKLTGGLKQYWKYVFRYKGASYRIAYEIKREVLLIVIILIGARENFYKQLKRRIK